MELHRFGAHHRNDSILSEGSLCKTTLKYDVPIYCKWLLAIEKKGPMIKTTLLF